MKTVQALVLVVALLAAPGCRCKKKCASENQQALPVLHVEERVSGVETALNLK